MTKLTLTHSRFRRSFSLREGEGGGRAAKAAWEGEGDSDQPLFPTPPRPAQIRRMNASLAPERIPVPGLCSMCSMPPVTFRAKP